MFFYCHPGGHELGSSLLFGYRLGFSGTPSNLLPEDGPTDTVNREFPGGRGGHVFFKDDKDWLIKPQHIIYTPPGMDDWNMFSMTRVRVVQLFDNTIPP